MQKDRFTNSAIRMKTISSAINHERIKKLAPLDPDLVRKWIKCACELHSATGQLSYHKVIQRRGAKEFRDVEFHQTEVESNQNASIKEIVELTKLLNKVAVTNKQIPILANIEQLSEEKITDVISNYVEENVKRDKMRRFA